VIESPASNLHRIRIRNGEPAFDDDSVPNVQVNVPLEPDITVPVAHPGSAVVGIPAPRYAVNISAHAFLPDNDVFHAELLGIHTQQPPYVPVTTILNDEINS